jgi:hypothetical protein
MAEEKKEQQDPIDAEEVAEEEAELLPDREVMSTLKLGQDPVIWDLPVEPRDGA